MPPDRRNMARKVAEIELPPGEQITDAAVHEGRSLLTLLSYGALFVYPLDRVSGKPARTVPLFARQCEALVVDGEDLLITNEERDVYRIAQFFTRDLRSLLPPPVSFFVRRLDPATTSLADGLPEATTALARVPLESDMATDVLRMGVCGDRLLMDGWLDITAATLVPTNQQSVSLGTALLFVAPRSGVAPRLTPDEPQFALVLREDHTVTLLDVTLTGGGGRPELVPGSRVEGRVVERRFTFRLSLPLARLGLTADVTTFRFNAATLAMRENHVEAIVSGRSVFALLRPRVAATAVVAARPPAAAPSASEPRIEAGAKSDDADPGEKDE
jgi:hypothetical protein